jgi:predicted nucleic acid-binding protein
VIAYWDTSAFILLYLEMPGKANAEVMYQTAELNLISKLTFLEAYRAFTSLAGHGQISRADARRAIERLRRDLPRFSARSVDGILQGTVLEKYLALLERHWKLGTNDVLHLTVAVAWKNELKRDVTLVTRDTQLAAAARRERLKSVIFSS